MNNRGLLDLIISILPELRIVERIALLMAFENEEQLYVQSKNDIEKIINRVLPNFWDISEIKEKAGRIDTICQMRGIKWVSWTDAEYPPLLRELYDPPSVLFYKGILPNPEKPLLGMVGTRKPSKEAAEQAYKIAGNLGREGISVISGLAHGIDAMAHRGNLISSVPGYAVLGSGIDEIYPSSNKPLAKRILDSGGAIMSEYPPGVHPTKFTFPARNRIIAALSRSVIIVEAPLKSGALITASFALDQGKDLWVASSGIFMAASGNTSTYKDFDRRGTIKLVSEGAEIIYSACDVLEKWNMKESKTNEKETALTMGSNREDMISSMADLLKIEM